MCFYHFAEVLICETRAREDECSATESSKNKSEIPVPRSFLPWSGGMGVKLPETYTFRELQRKKINSWFEVPPTRSDVPLLFME